MDGISVTPGGVRQVIHHDPLMDRLPVYLQVLRIVLIYDTGNHRIDCVLSDGMEFFTMTLVKRLHHLVRSKSISEGDIVCLSSYITQQLSESKCAVLCLDLSIVGHEEAVLGSPTEFITSSVAVDSSSPFVGELSNAPCPKCNETPCDWVVLGPVIVEAIKAKFGASCEGDGASFYKKCRFNAYSTFTRSKHGTLGKGKRVPLPECAMKGIRDNFPDPAEAYVGFVPGAEE